MQVELCMNEAEIVCWDLATLLEDIGLESRSCSQIVNDDNCFLLSFLFTLHIFLWCMHSVLYEREGNITL
jgi:hypothetical protein